MFYYCENIDKSMVTFKCRCGMFYWKTLFSTWDVMTHTHADKNYLIVYTRVIGKSFMDDVPTKNYVTKNVIIEINIFLCQY